MSSKNVLNLYLFLWCIFNVTFSAGIMISRPIYVILFIMTIYYGFKSLKIPHIPPYIKGLLVLTGMFIVYGVISILNGDKFYIEAVGKEVNSYIYLISISISIFPIYAFYYFSYRRIITSKLINKWIPIFLIASVATFYFSLRMLLDMGKNEDTLVINGGYSFVSIIPLLFFVKNRKLRWIYLTIIIIFSLLSVKRGAILISVLSASYLILQEIRNAPRRKKIIISTLTFVFVIGIFFIIYDIYTSNPFIQLRLQSIIEGDSSHRDEIYENIVNYWLNKETLTQQLFGMGASATLKIGENYAHNDWLEILINNGILGVFIFALYWMLLIKQIFRFKKKTELKNSFILLFFIGFTQTMFSMYYNDILTPMALCLGYGSGILNRTKTHQTKSLSKLKTINVQTAGSNIAVQ